MIVSKEDVRGFKSGVKTLGRYLMMSGEHLEKLLDGRKRTTIRLGRIVPKYKEIIIHSRAENILMFKGNIYIGC